MGSYIKHAGLRHYIRSQIGVVPTRPAIKYILHYSLEDAIDEDRRRNLQRVHRKYYRQDVTTHQEPQPIYKVFK